MALRRALPPFTIADMLTMVMELNDEQFSSLENNIKSAQAFSATEDRCARLADELGLSQENVEYLLSFLEFMYRRVQSEGGPEGASEEVIDSLFSSITFEPEVGQTEAAHKADVARLQTRLLRLSEFNEHAEARRKINRLKNGFLPNAVAFSSFVDLRPVIDADREHIDGYVLTTQLRISTEQADKEDSLVIQLSPHALNKLADAIDDAKKKLLLLQSDDFLASRIMN
jgi:hypothetical protein